MPRPYPKETIVWGPPRGPCPNLFVAAYPFPNLRLGLRSFVSDALTRA